MSDLAKLINQKIAEDIKVCEENIKHFSADNKYIQAIQRSLGRIKDLLTDPGALTDSQLIHDLRNPLASAFGYVDLVKMKASEKEKQFAENISNSLKNILEEIK